MSLSHSPQIPLNGLVLNLDAANIKSYPGTGTAWSDISGNLKNGTLTNGPTYSSANGGSLVFDGTNDYVLCSNSYTGTPVPTGSNPRTIIAAFRPTNLQNSYQHVVHYGTASLDNAFGLTLYTASGYRLSNHTWSGTSYLSTQTITNNNIYYAAVIFNDINTPKNRFFLNGAFGTTTFGQGKTADYSINTGTAFQVHIGSRISPSEYFAGNIYLVQIYDRALSDSEVVAGFNAYRGRFGI